MLRFWLEVLVKAILDTNKFIGKSWTGIEFAVLVVLLTVVWSAWKHGWSEATKHWLRTAGKGLAVAFIAYGAVLLVHLVYVPYHLEDDMSARWNNARQETSEARHKLDRCKSASRDEIANNKILQDELTSRQDQVNSEQRMLNNQQAAINNCVVSLGKMNPIVNQVTKVVVFPFATQTKRMGFLPHTMNVSIMFITTNRVMPPVGTVKCEKPFTPMMPPTLPIVSSSAILTDNPASRVNDREYEIRVVGTGLEWGPNSPMFFTISSDAASVGKCSFASR